MEENREPTLVWLEEKLKLDDAGLSKLVEKDLSLLDLGLDSHEERVTWLQKWLVMDDDGRSTLVKKLLPNIGMIVEENLEPKSTWLKTRQQGTSASWSR
jgi:hypothetical protein